MRAAGDGGWRGSASGGGLRRRLAWLLAAGLACALLGACRRPTGLEAPAGPTLAGGEGVVLVERPWIDGGCGRWCLEPYWRFAGRHFGLRPVLSRRQLDERIRATMEAPAAGPSGSSREELRDAVLDALRLDPLLAGLEERILAVAVLEETVASGVVRRKQLFWDPWVGSFEGTLLLPDGPGPYPAVVGLHGHRDSDEVFASDYMGKRLARSGFAVLMPRFRAFDCSPTEYLIARRLLRHGSALIGLRVYETLLMAKLLASLEEVDVTRVGLLTHSGGGHVANLAARISDRFAALVIDIERSEVDYRNLCGLLGEHCETVPDLFPLAGDIYDGSTLPAPRLVVPYKFPAPDVRERILQFFVDRLGAAPSASGGTEQAPAAAILSPPVRREFPADSR